MVIGALAWSGVFLGVIGSATGIGLRLLLGSGGVLFALFALTVVSYRPWRKGSFASSRQCTGVISRQLSPMPKSCIA
jgi:hypothetical protein